VRIVPKIEHFIYNCQFLINYTLSTNLRANILEEDNIYSRSAQPPSISVIIPAYNEEKRLGGCLKRTFEFFSSANWDFEIIVAEDGSTDGTISIVQEFSRETDRIRLVSSKDRSGKGGAIKRVIKSVEKKLVGYMDADLSADPEEFSRLVRYIHAFDVVIGSRMLRGELPPIIRPASRTLLSMGYSNLFRLLFRAGIQDPQCGLKLFKTEVISSVVSMVKTHGFAFDSELLAWTSRLGFKVKEVPINWMHKEGSKILPPVEIMSMSKDLFSIWRRVQTSRIVVPERLLPQVTVAPTQNINLASQLID
jgi:glycosyltransferase involved in cell wall biosynthesis